MKLRALGLCGVLGGVCGAQAEGALNSMGPKVGEPALSIELEELFQAPDGAAATLEALEGKVVVMEFWATWCMPCIAAFPHMNELAAHYQGNDGIVFLSITDETREFAEKTLKDSPLGSWVGLDTDRSIFDAYGVNAIPRTIIIGKDGRIAADTYPMMVTVESLDQILAGEETDLPTMAEIMGRAGDEEVDRRGAPGMPQSIAEMNQLQISETVPGVEHERLEGLAGTWISTTTLSPAGPMGPKLESESEIYRRWIQGGRVLSETVELDGTNGLVKQSYYGYDAEKEEYYLCVISPMESKPVIWTGEWDEERSSFEFSRTMEIKMMSGPEGDKANAKSIELDLYLSILIRGKHSYETTVSVDFGDGGMGMPSGEQEMSSSVARRP